MRTPACTARIRRRATLWKALFGVASVAMALAPMRTIRAQGSSFLLLPIGARSVGAGEALIADTLGVDGIWWNPSSMASMSRSELAINGSQTVEGNSAAIGFARPSRVLGTIAAAANILDYGTQGVVDSAGVEGATATVRSSILLLSYATQIGSRLRVGLSYKYARLAFTCVGDVLFCGTESQFVGASSAVDFGAQYVLPTKIPVTVGAAVRNLGPSFQVKDSEQADPLPRTWQTGASARVFETAVDSAGLTLDMMADLLGSLAYEGVSARLGGVLTYDARYSLRAGYTLVEGERGGAAIGLGVELSEGMGIDIARRFDAFSALAGVPPTFVTLRFRF